MNFYPMYPGDYGRDTAHLTLAEHGAYLILLNHQYSTEKPLPLDIEVIHRICRSSTPAERTAVESVVEQFFPQHGAGRMNRRAARQIPKEQERIEIARKNGKKGGRPQEPSGIPSGLANENPAGTPAAKLPVSHPVSVSVTYPELPPATPQQLKEKSQTRARTSRALDPDFLLFWQAYPNKTGKGAALKVWNKLNGHAVPIGEMLGAIDQQKSTDKWKLEGGRFIPNPATWLNQERWADEPITVQRESDWSDRA